MMVRDMHFVVWVLVHLPNQSSLALHFDFASQDYRQLYIQAISSGALPLYYVTLMNLIRCWYNLNACFRLLVSDTKLSPTVNVKAVGNIYVIGTTMTNACPGGSVAIETALECQAAAQSLGRTWENEENAAAWPRACHHDGSNSVFFNKHDLGARQILSAPICKLQAPCFALTFCKRVHLLCMRWCYQSEALSQYDCACVVDFSLGSFLGYSIVLGRPVLVSWFCIQWRGLNPVSVQLHYLLET